MDDAIENLVSKLSGVQRCGITLVFLLLELQHYSVWPWLLSVRLETN
jgi:hypothetical protein